MDEDPAAPANGGNGDDMAQYNLDEYDDEDNMPGEIIYDLIRSGLYSKYLLQPWGRSVISKVFNITGITTRIHTSL